MWYVDKHFWVIRTSQLSPEWWWADVSLRQLLFPEWHLDLTISRHTLLSPWQCLVVNGHMWSTCPDKSHLALFSLSFGGSACCGGSLRFCRWVIWNTPPCKQAFKMPTYSPSFWHSFESFFSLLLLFKSHTFFYAWWLKNGWSSRLLFVSWASRGSVPWPVKGYIGLLLPWHFFFRRCEFCVNKYSRMAFELSSLEHETTACWSFLHSTSNFSSCILGSSETVVICRASRILFHSTSVRAEWSPSAPETYYFPWLPKEKERQRSFGFSLCLKRTRKSSHAFFADSFCEDRNTI